MLRSRVSPLGGPADFDLISCETILSLIRYDRCQSCHFNFIPPGPAMRPWIYPGIRLLVRPWISANIHVMHIPMEISIYLYICIYIYIVIYIYIYIDRSNVSRYISMGTHAYGT